MKTQIRRSVFETNSSSIHCISIIKNFDKNISEYIDVLTFGSGEFGWEHTVYFDYGSKASYLWYGIKACCPQTKEEMNKWTCSVTYEDAIKWITEVLAKYNIIAEFKYNHLVEKEINHYKFTEYCDSLGNPDDGYVDHSSELQNFVEDILHDEEKLLNYLFSEKSYIETGNDNEDIDFLVPNFGNSWEYYKGN